MKSVTSFSLLIVIVLFDVVFSHLSCVTRPIEFIVSQKTLCELNFGATFTV